MPTIIKCIVHDKKVVDVLRVLKPYAFEPPVADAMDEAPLNSKRMAASGSISKLVFDYVAKSAKTGKKTVTSRELKDELMAKGAKDNSYSYGLKLLLEKKKLKRTSHPSTYEIVK